MSARYAVNTSKALEVILWLATKRPGIDFYHIVKCAFYADKFHVNRHGRPIAGDNYVADTYGPLGRTIYGLLTGSPLEILALNGNGDLPFSIVGRYQVNATRGPNLRRLSESDVEALSHALDACADKSFDELFDESHRERAFIAANGGPIRYEDFFAYDDPDREEKIEDLEETASSAVF
jgi:hypothetical protein